MTIKDQLHHLVDDLDEDAATELLDYAEWLSRETDTLDQEEERRVLEGEAEIARGEFTTLEELRRKLGV